MIPLYYNNMNPNKVEEMAKPKTEKCPICLEIFSVDLFEKLSCNHKICK